MARLAACALLIALLAGALPTVSGAPAVFAFTDAAGDVRQAGHPAVGPWADAVDILQAGLAEGASGVTASLQVQDLSAASQLGLSGAQADYVLLFVSGPNDAGHQLHAHYGAAASGTLVVPSPAVWSFEAVDRASGRAAAVAGDVSGNTLQWTVPAPALGLAPGLVLAGWQAAAWVTLAGQAQMADGASTSAGYSVGQGPVADPRYAAPYDAPGSWTAFVDASGDVSGGSPGGEAADDVLSARVADNGTSLVLELQLRDLSRIGQETAQAGFDAQYALCFESQRLCARASFGGIKYTARKDGAWRFNVHHEATDTWPAAEGYAIGDSLVWLLPLRDLGLREGDVLTGWSVQTWNSYDDAPQYGDWGGSPTSKYTVGLSAPQLDPPAIPATARPTPSAAILRWVGDSWQALWDDAGDVTRDGTPYSGPGAAGTDVTGAWVWEEGDGLGFALHLADADAVRQDLRDDYDVQYALTFEVAAQHRLYSMRADFGGKEYTNDPDGAWRFMLHDQQEDLWPAVDGAVVNSTLVWNVPYSMLGIQAGDTLGQWEVQTWASFRTTRAQYGDWAQDPGAYTVGARPAVQQQGDFRGGAQGQPGPAVASPVRSVPLHSAPGAWALLPLALAAVGARRLRSRGGATTR